MAISKAGVVIASRNAGKVAEFKELLQGGFRAHRVPRPSTGWAPGTGRAPGGYPRPQSNEYPRLLSGGHPAVEILSLENYPGLLEVEETGASFQENALLKARAAADATGLVAMADDSGLEVDYLKGAPGIYSSRYAGPERDDAANIRKLLAALDGVPASRRTARFRCVIAICTPEGGEYLSEGVCEGRITREPRGTGGFGYDPVFLVPSLGLTFAELGAPIKNRISHRAQAMKNAGEILISLLRSELEGAEDAGRCPE